MKIKALTQNEDTIVCTFVASTVANDENAEITVQFSNGYALDILRDGTRIFIEIMHEIKPTVKGEKPIRRYLSDNDRIDTDGAFVYNSREIRRFFEIVAKAESTFEVAFAYGRLKQL